MSGISYIDYLKKIRSRLRENGLEDEIIGVYVDEDDVMEEREEKVEVDSDDKPDKI